MSLIFIAAVLFIIYLVTTESHSTRSLIPIALMIALVANILIVLWVFIYIGFMYHNNKIKTSDDGYETKSLYIFMHVIVQIVNGVLFAVWYCRSKQWVDNLNQKQ